MPGFQFGAASSSTPSIASPSSIDSERNSPDSVRSFPFGGDEENQPSPPYDTYTSRFSSVASIATSESSLNSGYYGGLTADQDRRDSTWYVYIYLATFGYGTDAGNSDPQYFALHSELDIDRPDVHNLGTGEEMGIPTGIIVGYSPPVEYASYGGANGLSLSIPDMQQAQSEPQHQAYVSPTPAIGIASEIHGHGQDAPSMPISTSSELAFALERKRPELVSNILSCDLLVRPLTFLHGEVDRHRHTFVHIGSIRQFWSWRTSLPKSCRTLSCTPTADVLHNGCPDIPSRTASLPYYILIHE
jgi:hypothetical protein